MSADVQIYERLKDSAQSPDPETRLKVAVNPKSPGELLYFLASDPVPEVRQAVAQNPATPRQADQLLAQDEDYDVRCMLARKIVGTGLEEDDRDQLWRLGFTILETLARDKVIRVRAALAEAIKGIFTAPRPVVLALASDVERSVAEPVIRHSPVLLDEDVMTLVGRDGPEWLKTAAAARNEIGPKLAESIVNSGSTEAITELLRNKKSQITDATLERIIAKAPMVEAWHKPLVERPSLPGLAIPKIAKFVGAPLLSLLRGRKDLDEKAAAKIDGIADQRGEKFSAAACKGAANSKHASKSSWKDRAQAAGQTVGKTSSGKISKTALGWGSNQEKVQGLAANGKLTNEVIRKALETGDKEFAIAALGQRTGFSLEIINRILDSRNGRLVTALCWKSGLSMRAALDVQRKIAQVPPKRMVYARGGEDYPMTPEELDAALTLFNT